METFFFPSEGKTELYIHDRPLRFPHSRSLVATLPPRFHLHDGHVCDDSGNQPAHDAPLAGSFCHTHIYPSLVVRLDFVSGPPGAPTGRLPTESGRT